MRLERLLEIVILLLNRRQLTARELAERFELSVRTVYRDMEAINAAGIPVVATQGPGGGFALPGQYTVDSRLLSLEEIGSILTALRGLKSSLDSPELDRVISKVASLVPGEQAEAFSRHLDVLVVEMAPWGMAGERRDLVRLVHQAILEARLLTFDYRAPDGQATRRTVEPMTLLYRGQSWYLFGWCRLRAGFRVFRLSRMRDPELQLRSFVRRAGSWREHVDVEPAASGAVPVDLRLRFRPAARGRVEDFFPGDAIRVFPDGGLEVAVTYPDGEWVTAMLLGYGELVEVLAPASVRERIRARAEATAKVYGG